MSVGDRVAGETGLRVGLGRAGTDQEVHDRALTCPGTADDRDVQRFRRLAVEIRADDVADQRGRQP